MNVFVFVQGFAAFVDPDPVEQESPDVILACAGQKENLSEFLYDIATILMEEASVRTKTHLSVKEPPLPRNLDPDYFTSTLYFEVFQETSAGDFGVELLPDGPLFRCHSSVINSVFPGFLSRIRADGQKRPLSCAIPKKSCLKAFRDLANWEARARLLKDAEFAAFSQPSNLSGLNAQAFIANMMQMENSAVPNVIGPTVGQIRRADPFRLAERYGIQEDCEHMVELLRFMYQGHVSYFKKEYLDSLTPKLKSAIWSHVRDMLFLGEKYAVDKLFKRCLDWFTEKCLYECGDTAFCESFYQLEHHIERTREPLFREMLRRKVIGLLADRQQFRIVTNDKRWATLSCSIMTDILSSQALAISNELEILQLVKRWDAQTDKAKEDVFLLMQTFRPDFAGGYQAVDRMCGNYGFDIDEMFPLEKRFDPVEFAKLPAYLRRKRAAKMRPRSNVSTKESQSEIANGENDDDADVLALMQHAGLVEQTNALDDAAEVEKQEREKENHFQLRCGQEVIEEGFAFSLAKSQMIMQSQVITKVGEYRVRVTISQLGKRSWDTKHRVFVGATYGNGTFFGYYVSLTDYAGIYDLQFCAHAAMDPDNEIESTKCTGSG